MNTTQAEAMKTCFGILAIMSREEANKALIAKDGMEIILNVMTAHIDRTDVQEAGCDLLWSLAFNSTTVKEIIAKYNGATVLVRALKRHSRSSDFLKSACGALSNVCQFRANQEGVASQGGLQPLIAALHIHQSNGKLLPFIFDAIASIIVNNEDNARSVSALGIIPVVVASLSRHKTSSEVVKSGCHSLAILSDVKGQASKIAFAGGVPVILSLLDHHPVYADLHRVAAVVLLRMLQESSHVGKEICCHEGVRILLNSLEKGGAQQDTVAATTHILYTITNPSSPTFSSIEPQLWVSSVSNGEGSGGECAHLAGHDVEVQGVAGGSLLAAKPGGNQSSVQTALGGVIRTLEQYCTRRDVVRASCRLLTNLAAYPHVALALDRLCIVAKICNCISIHRETKDVVEAATVLMRTIMRKKNSPAMFGGSSSSSISGLIHVMRMKLHDDETVGHCMDLFSSLILDGKGGKPQDSGKEPKTWEQTVTIVCNDIVEIVLSALTKEDAVAASSSSSSSSATSLGIAAAPIEIRGTGKQHLFSSLSSPKLVLALKALAFVENCISYSRLEAADPVVQIIAESFNRLLKLGRGITNSGPNCVVSDLCIRCQMFLSSLQEATVAAATASAAAAASTSAPASSSASASAAALATVPSSAALGTDSLSNGLGSHFVESNGHASAGLGEVQKTMSSSRAFLRTTAQQSLAAHSNAASGMENGVLDASLSFRPHTESSSSKKSMALPQHPLKLRNGPRSLLNNWPGYLERLHTQSPTSFLRMSSLAGADLASIPQRMHLCYDSNRAGGRNLVSKFPTPLPYAVPAGGVGLPFEHSLTFDSEFESGNLHRAIQVGDAMYDLILRADVHTQGHTQWFYFAVSNTHPAELVRLASQGVVVPAVRVKFNIINFTKPDSLFNLGMRPVVYSTKDAGERSCGWVRAGHEISYYPNSFSRNNTAGEGIGNYYSLSFTIEFQHPNDTVLIAYSYPYTMSDHKQHMEELLEKPGQAEVLRRLKLCSTLGGEDCELLVITDFKDRDRVGPISMTNMEIPISDDPIAVATAGTSKSRKASKVTYKPALFLSGRVHPGETPASWMMKGILDFLTSDSPSAVLLRKLFVVFVVPVLNPDGVILGNNRCSLAGVDLNRQWKLPDKANHPTIYHLKLFMALQKRLRDVAMFIDLHGHSRKYNVFMYGCDDKKKPKPQVRAFPRFLASHNIGGKYVCFDDCSFHVKKGRESTARVVVAKDMSIPCSFTLEATFCGSNYGPLKNCHMNIGHLLEVGAALCDAIVKFSISEGLGKDLLVVSSESIKNVHATAFEGLNILNSASTAGTILDRGSVLAKDEMGVLPLEDRNAGADVAAPGDDDEAEEITTQDDEADMPTENDMGAAEESDSESENSSGKLRAVDAKLIGCAISSGEQIATETALVETTADEDNFAKMRVLRSFPPQQPIRMPSSDGTIDSDNSRETTDRETRKDELSILGAGSHTSTTHSIAGDVFSNTVQSSSLIRSSQESVTSVTGLSKTLDVINDG